MPINTSVNSQSVNVLLAKRLQENFWVGLLHMPDKGVNEGFSQDTNASTIRIVRQIPPGIKGRTLGASVNGAAFNEDGAVTPSSEEFELPLLYMYDGNIDIAEVTEDMFPLSIIEAEGDAMGGEFAGEVNASTIAEQLSAAINEAAKKGEAFVALPSTLTETSYRDALLKALSRLSNGDVEHGVKTFPKKNREIIVRPDFSAGLFTAKNILVGGSNYAQELLAKGRIDPNTYNDNGDAYIGEFMSVPVYEAPDGEFSNAEAWLDSFDGTTGTALNAGALDGVRAIVCSSVGTVRGICIGNRIKQIDAPGGAGIRLQPKMRWGVKTIYPKSVAPIVSASFKTSDLATFASGAFTKSLKVTAPRSRKKV